MRVKMAVETEDSSRLTWLEGTVAGAELADSGRWPRSPWRMLQVTWDEPEVCQSVRMVSPWQVELVCDSPHMQSLFPAMKKLKVPLPHCLELSGERQGCIPFPMAGFKSTKMESLTSSLFNYNTFPAGMQGARHDFCVPSLSNFVPRKTQNMFSDNPHGINMPRKSNILQSEGMSPLSEKCVRNHGMGILDGPTCNSTRKVRKGSFQLFGQIIHMEQPNDAIDKDYVENEGGVRSLDFSLAYPHKQYLDSIDIQRQRAVEACSL